MRRTPSSEPRRPLSLPVIHILLGLAGGAKHGYAIKQDVEERTGGAIRLGPGTLYEAIQRLLDSGLIEESTGLDDPANGQQAQRRVYGLTEAGWEALKSEIGQLGALVDHARSHPRLRKRLV